MQGIRDYRLLPTGDLMVRTVRGRERKATEKEWIAIWLRDPSLTLALAGKTH